MREYIEKSKVERMLWAVIMCKDERTIKEMLEDAPTVQAIPLAKVKQAREEIENKIHKDPYLNFSNRNRERNDAFIEVLEILDKLIESEDKSGKEQDNGNDW